MPVSKSIAGVHESLRDAKEILIPYPVAKSRYGAAVAAIIDQLNESTASEAKDKSPESFKWFLVYTQPEDPETTDEGLFAKNLMESTRVFLLCRGFRWRGVVELDGDLPEQVRSRYEERARLMCAGPLPASNELPDLVNPMNGRKGKRDRSLDDDIGNILTMVSALGENHRVESGYLRIIEMALKSLRKRA